MVNTVVIQALKSAGQKNVDLKTIDGVDHFDLLERLSDQNYSLTQASASLLSYSWLSFFINVQIQKNKDNVN